MKKSNVNQQGIRYFYPVFIIIFILFTLYLFIFGKNGFYSHKTKLQTISQLEKENQGVINKIAKYDNKIKNFQLLDPFTVEKEARSIPLKKKGDIIIKLYHKKWIEEQGKKYQKQFKLNKLHDKESSISHYKVVMGITISLIIAFFLTHLSPWEKKND